MSEPFPRRTVQEHLAHDHAERDPQGTDTGNRILFPDSRAAATGTGVVRHTRLGGLLSFYHRASA